MDSDNPKVQKRKTKRACVQCKLRKKKCTGELPCGYCIKMGKGQQCEYRARHSSKTVKITVKYLTSLKTRIRELENEPPRNSSSEDVRKEVDEIGLLVDSDPENISLGKERNHAELKASNEEWERQPHQYLGDSSCFRFLAVVRESLVGAGLSYEKILAPKVQLTCLEVNTDFFEIERLIKSQIPTIDRATYLISKGEGTIGADYVCIEPNYSSRKVAELIYSSNVSRDEVSIIRFVTEMARLYSYLALGSLFEYEINPPKFPGLLYFKTALILQDYLLKT